MNNQGVCAVIVSYNSPENAISCINSALNQVEKIIVVDNSPDTRSRERFKNIHYPDKVSFAYNEVNKGLGCALNQGIQYSLTNNYRWTLLLDQDSALTENMVGEMLRSYNNLSNEAQKGVALIIPKVYDLNFGKILPPILTTNLMNKKIKDPEKDIFIHFQITSGTLIKNETVKDIGLMNEQFFIDYIDFDYCFRVLEKGFKLLLSRNALLYHRLAEKRQKLFFCFREHPPLRVYYQTRNRLFTLFNYGKKHKSFLYSEICRFVSKFIKILLLESNKKKKIKMYFQGIADFIVMFRRNKMNTLLP